MKDDPTHKDLMNERAYKQLGVRWFHQKLSAYGNKSGDHCLLVKGLGSCCYLIRLLVVRFRCCSGPSGRVISSLLPVVRGIVSACCYCIYYFPINFWYVSVNQTHSNSTTFDSLWIVPSLLCFHPPASLAFYSVSFSSQLNPGGFSSLQVIICFPLQLVSRALLLIFSSQDCSIILISLI